MYVLCTYISLLQTQLVSWWYSNAYFETTSSQESHNKKARVGVGTWKGRPTRRAMKVRISSLESSLEKKYFFFQLIISDHYFEFWSLGKNLYCFRTRELNEDMTHKYYLKIKTLVLFMDPESRRISGTVSFIPL